MAEHLGFGEVTGVGKLMGLAAYGQPVYAFDFLHADHDGGYLIDLSRYDLYPSEDVASSYANLNYYRRLKRAYGAAFADLGVPRRQRIRLYDKASGRSVADATFTPAEANLAASAQHILQCCLLQLARAALVQAGSTRLCIAGGVGLNCSANGVLHRYSGASKMFVQPAAGDAGCAIGAALECVRRAGHLAIPRAPFVDTALGPAFTDEAIRQTLDNCRIKYAYFDEDITNPVACALATGSVVGWFQGPCEGGPRALGHRSILADPRRAESRDQINREIKFREMWRPFAPSMLASAAERYIVESGPASFMVVAYEGTESAKIDIPATVHVDGSLRPHIVNASINPRYAALLSAFKFETDIPALLNTSFNHDGEPIVCTPTDALRTFFSSPIDALALGGFYVTKNCG